MGLEISPPSWQEALIKTVRDKCHDWEERLRKALEEQQAALSIANKRTT